MIRNLLLSKREHAWLACSLLCFVTIATSSVFAQQTWSTFLYADSIPRTSLVVDRQGRVWAATLPRPNSQNTATGISMFDGSAWKLYTSADGLPSDSMASNLSNHSIACSRSGDVWAAGKRGIARYDASRDAWQTVALHDSLEAYRQYLALAIDSSNNIWVSSRSLIFSHWLGSDPVYNEFTQIHRYDGAGWQTFDFTLPIHTGSVMTELACDRTGNVWAAGEQNYDQSTHEYYGGLMKYDGLSWTTYDVAGMRTKGDQQITGLVVAAGKVWITTLFGSRYGAGALSVFDGNSWRIDSSIFPKGSGSIKDMQIDPNGVLWLACSAGTFGVVAFDGSKVRANYQQNNSGLFSNAISSIAIGRDNQMWFGSPLALSELRGELNAVINDGEDRLTAYVWPNPVSRASALRYELSEPSQVSIRLYDATGVCVSSVPAAEQSAGLHSLTLPLSGLANGEYRLDLEAESTRGIVDRRIVNVVVAR